jgi:hypothetical protein
VNCTTGNNVPSGPLPLIYNVDDIVNVSISVPTPPTSGLSTNVPASQLNGFINGTAVGLVCLVPPGVNENAWPYGGGGVNAAIPGAPTSTTSGGPSGTSGTAVNTSGTSSSPSGSTPASAGQLGVEMNLHSSLVLGTVIVGVIMGILVL